VVVPRGGWIGRRAVRCYRSRMARIELPAGDQDELSRLYAMNPELTGVAAGFSAAVYASDVVPVRVRELMRLRIAQINHCQICLDTRVADLSEHGLTEADCERVGEWATWPGFSSAERLAIEYADRFALDHLALDDRWFARAREHFTDSQLHAMALMIGSWIALGRMQAVFDVSTACAIRL
jgi:AhpD family alkylhydroperoxidase